VLTSVFTQLDQTIDPAMLSMHLVSGFPNVTSFAKALLGGGLDRKSFPDSNEQIESAVAPKTITSIESWNAAENAHPTNTSLTGYTESQLDLPLQNDARGEDLDLDLDLDMDLDRLIGCLSPGENQDLNRNTNNQKNSCGCVTTDQQVNHRSALKRKAPHTHTAVRKKFSDSNKSQNWNGLLATFLSEEAVRCSEHGWPPPEDTFFTPVIRAAVQDLCETKMDMLARILVFIGSSNSIAALQEVLHRSRTEEGFMPLQSGARLSKAERVTLIQKLDQSITHLQLLRRHHVLELFRESGGPETRSNGGFVVITPQTFDKAQSKSGNPSNSAEAEVTVNMMVELFPGIRTDSDDYNTKYRMTTQLRKLGQRLHMLEEAFGKGILGLMLDRGITGSLDFGISDHV
jgi:hypothetical protein